MAALVEGSNYGLSSQFSSSNSNKSAFHVKLTDSALRAIEEFQKIKDAVIPRKPTIQFKGNAGVIKIPIKKSSDNTEGFRTFHFGCATIQGDPKGSFDCLKQQRSYGDGDELSSLGSMSQKLVVRATDDVFDDTKKKMTLAEEESKKQCAKEIKPGASQRIGKKISKKVKRENLDLPLAQSSELSRTSMGASKHSPSSHSKPIVSKPSSAHNAGGRSSPVSSFGNKSHHQSSSSSSSSARSGSSPHHPYSNKAHNPAAVNLPFRDRIIHLLALRPYKKPELLIRLQRDGIRDKDKDSMSGILHSVGVFNPKDNSFTLAKHLYDGVREDWPLYSELDRQLLKRRRPQECGSASSSPVPSLSPAHSNCSIASSPTNSQKRPSSTSDLLDIVPLKKPRIAHERREKKPEQDRIDIGRSEIKMRSPDLKGRSPEVKASSPDGKGMSPEGKARSPDSTTPPERGPHKHKDRSLREHHNNNKTEEVTEASSTSDTPSYILKYTTISTREQRAKYKEIFNTEYEEYRHLHASVDNVTKRFKKLEKEIKSVKQGTEDYENVKNKIFNEYRTIKRDKKYIDQRKRCDYLHGKLGHIKKLILEFDQQHS